MKKYNYLPIVLAVVFGLLCAGPAHSLTIVQFERVKTIESASLKSPLQVRFFKDQFYILDGRHNLLLTVDSNNLNHEMESIVLVPRQDLQKKPTFPRKITSFAISQHEIFALDPKNKTILVLIQWTGDVRAGIWAWSVVMNDKMSLGSVFPQLEYAKEHGYAVIVFNPNYDQNEEGKAVDS